MIVGVSKLPYFETFVDMRFYSFLVKFCNGFEDFDALFNSTLRSQPSHGLVDEPAMVEFYLHKSWVLGKANLEQDDARLREV